MDFSIEIGVGNHLVDVGQPDIVTLCTITI